MLEVMLGAMVLLVIICVSLFAYSQSMLLNQSSRNLGIAANDAQHVLEEIKALPYGGIPAYTPPVFNSLNSETVSLSRIVEPYLTTVTVNVQWQERAVVKNFSLASCFAKK